MNEQVLTAKKAVVAELNERLATANAAIVVGYQGLSVKELTVLRKSLKEAGARMEIQKNTLMRRAVDFEGYSALDELLTGQNAIVTSDDSICARPVLFKFVKSNKTLVIKGGVIEKTYCDVDSLQGLSKVGSKEGAISMLLSVLEAPIRNLACGLKAVSEAK